MIQEQSNDNLPPTTIGKASPLYMAKTFQTALQLFHRGNLKSFSLLRPQSLKRLKNLTPTYFTECSPILMSSIDFARRGAYFWPIIQIALKTTTEDDEKKRGANNYIIIEKSWSLSSS